MNRLKLLFTLPCFLLASLVAAQAPFIQWQKSLGGSSDEHSNSVVQTLDSGYVVAGYSASSDGNVTGHHGDKDYWIVRTDASGALVWQHSFGGLGQDVATCIVQTTDSGYAVTGYSYSAEGDVTAHHGTTANTDIWVIRLDAAGNLQWQKSLGGTADDYAGSIIQSSDGGYLVAGASESSNGDVSSNAGASDLWVVKLDAAGAIEWQHTYGGSDYEHATTALAAPDSGYVIFGTTTSADGDVGLNHGLTDYWFIHISPSGILQWEKTYGGSNSEYAADLRQTADGGYILAGSTYSNDGDVTVNFAGPEYWMVKTDSAGNLEWQKPIGGQGSDEALAVQPCVDGGFLVAGHSASTDGDVTGNHGVWDAWLAKLSSAGALLWQHCYGGVGDEGATMIQATPDDGFIFCGHAMMNSGDVTGNHGGHDYWLVKLGSSVGIDPAHTGNVSFIYPNPVTGHFGLMLPANITECSLDVLDLTGRRLLGPVAYHTTSPPVDVQGLPSGMYLVQATSPDWNQTFRIFIP